MIPPAAAFGPLASRCRTPPHQPGGRRLCGGHTVAYPALAPPASAGCPDAEVVFARGTGEPPGLGRVGQAFVSSLRQQTNKSIGTYGVNYPANGDFLAAADGANDASDHIQQMASACRATRLVLGGYSQGAAVIDIVTAAPLPGLGFTQPLPPAADDHIAAIALFGNPSGRAGG